MILREDLKKMDVECNSPLNCDKCSSYAVGVQNEIIGNLTSFSDDHIKSSFSKHEKQKYIVSQINVLKWRVIIWKLIASLFMASTAILWFVKH